MLNRIKNYHSKSGAATKGLALADHSYIKVLYHKMLEVKSDLMLRNKSDLSEGVLSVDKISHLGAISSPL